MDLPPASIGAGAEAPLAPRYRRILGFGDILDVSISTWRQHFVTYALISAVGLLPPGLVLIALGAFGFVQNTQFNVSNNTAPTFSPEVIVGAIAGLSLYSVIAAVFGLLWTAAVVIATDLYLHGGEPSIGAVYRRALGSFWSLLGGGILFILAMIGLSIGAAILLVPTLGGLLGGPIAIICLLIWWAAPSTRRTWFKWLIVLVAPFGLVMYYSGRWAMYVTAVVLEHAGPTGALKRSWHLTEDHWFLVAGILGIAGLIVGIVISVITNLVQLPMTIIAATHGAAGLTGSELALVYSVQTICQILISAITGAVYTVLFSDLRNRREGTDIAERVSTLESSPSPYSANA
jgi:membrane-anchored glycerophosphoryl diester phosphodiesterase (GDPDase)